MSLDSLKTGDILLFNEYPKNFMWATVDFIIRSCSQSKYSHAGFVIVDPPWAPKGTYVWDSSYHYQPDPQDKKVKFGVALVPISQYLDQSSGPKILFKRSPKKPSTYKKFSKEFITKMHDKVYGKHYDLQAGHWLAGLMHLIVPRSTKQFFCSAFVSYLLTKAGIMNRLTDWTIISPGELSSANDPNMPWELEYGPDTQIVLT